MEVKTLLAGKRLKIIVGIGIVGILLIFLSNFFTKKEAPKATDAVQAAQQETQLSNEEYEKRYEETVLQLVQSIEGAGSAKVFVTLESGVQYIYETEENKTADTQSGDTQSRSEKSSLQRKTLLVEDDNGHKKPLLKTTLEPKVRGVVVVCEGGGDIRIIERVTSAVKTVLGVSSTRVTVLKAA